MQQTSILSLLKLGRSKGDNFMTWFGVFNQHEFVQKHKLSCRQLEEQEKRQSNRRREKFIMQSSCCRNFIRKDWSVFNGTGFQYDASIEYHNHPLIVIGSMNKKCEYCDAFKRNDETNGMCCSSGKVSLPLLGEPDIL
ncbi:uncharacterized protein TNCV_4579491 [Trichonephila clavipes]|nr:uncharacterized protein TNCV_4579491 [Trichonephila clavipes]